MSETPPAGYRKLPDGTRCRCIRLWQDGVGGFYCCRSSATLAFADSLSQHCPNCEAQAAEIEKLREALRHANEAHWFYYGDDCSSDACRMDIHECIDEDFEWDNKPEGDHVLLISGARPVPDMWVALHYFTEEEKDARQDDEPYTYTVHATQAEADAALGETK